MTWVRLQGPLHPENLELDASYLVTYAKRGQRCRIVHGVYGGMACANRGTSGRKRMLGILLTTAEEQTLFVPWRAVLEIEREV